MNDYGLGQNYVSGSLPGTSGSVFQGIGTGVANFFTGDLDYARDIEMANANFQYSAAEAQKNRDFQERMSNTQYQRAVEDLKAAGLNPYLAYSQGGAGTPAGSVANASGHSTAKASGFGQLISALVGGLFKMSAQSMANQNAMARDLIKANNARDIAHERNEYLVNLQDARDLAAWDRHVTSTWYRR